MSLIFTFSLTSQAAVPAPDFDAATKTFRETLGELIKADTTNPPGNEARAVAILAARLKKEGIPYSVVEFAPGRENLVARRKGTGPSRD